MAASGNFSKSVDGCDVAYDVVCTKCTSDNEAFLYCPTCDAFYCKACLHALCKHVLLGQDAKDRWGKKAPAQIDVEVECSKHKGYRLDLFCRIHDAVACSMCSQIDHKDCNMEFTPNVAGETNLADSESDLKSYAQQLRQQADHIKRDRTSRQADVQARKVAALKSVHDFVEKVKDMGAVAVKEIEAHASTCDGALQSELDGCNAAVTDITSVESSVSKNVHDKYTRFIKAKQSKTSLEATEKMLNGLRNKQKVENEDSVFQLNPDVNAAITKCNKLGSFKKIPSRPSASSPRPYKASNKRDVSVKVSEDRSTCVIEGVCQLPDGSVVVSDRINKKLKKLDGSYKVTCHCSLPDSPLGVCHIDGDEVVVALSNKTIQFVSVGDSMALTRSLSPGHGCRGVAHHQGRLYVTGGGLGTGETVALYVYSLSGFQLHVFTKDQNGQNILSDPWYIALSPSGSTVYVADGNIGLVTMDTQGHVLATFSPSGLKGAVGVAVADGGSVFVGGHSSYNVIQVGEEGSTKLADVVASSAGIKYPNGICLDKQRSKLIVGMEDDDCLIVGMEDDDCLAVFDLTH